MKFYIMMLLILNFILMVFTAQAKIPNAGFENWTQVNRRDGSPIILAA